MPMRSQRACSSTRSHSLLKYYMNNLLETTIKAHGGFERWKMYNTVSAHLSVDGLTWIRKQQPGVVKDVWVDVNTEFQEVLFRQTVDDKLTAQFAKDRITVRDQFGKPLDVLEHPRRSFEGHTRESGWSLPQAFYFASYAIWIYFNAPFVFAEPGYIIEEISPWEENGEQWRRLQVTFPDGVHTHSRVQTFYIDNTGLIRRHDYNVEISANVASAHYLYDYTDMQGIKFPTKRMVYLRKEDNTSVQPEPLLVKVGIDSLKLD
jgi:hypothetical protein